MSDTPKWRIRQALPSEVKHLSELAFRSKSYWGYSDRFMQVCREELTLDPRYIESNPTWLISKESAKHEEKPSFFKKTWFLCTKS